jgi:perosamine synthetase
VRIPLSAPDVTESDIEAVTEVLRTPRLSLGPRLAELERAMADYIGVPYAVAVSSGTAGLHLCVRALGLGAGDEVITTPLSFVASANVLLYEAARPRFVDVDETSLGLDPARIEAALTPRTRAILVVHLFGRPAAMREILELAERHGLAVIEDACEAIGAEYGGARVGSLGRAGVFGFYPNKPITTGEGGVITTADPDLDALFRRLRNQGRDPSLDWYQHVDLGYNYRLSEINCALGLAQLRRITPILERRFALARAYHERLAAEPQLLLPEPDEGDARTSWFAYNVRLRAPSDRSRRDRIVAEMRALGIECGRYFAPIHLQPLYVRRFGYAPGAFPICEAAAERSIALPFFGRLREAEIDEVCDSLRRLLAGTV